MSPSDNQLYGVWNDTKDRWCYGYYDTKDEMNKLCRQLNACLAPTSFSVRLVADQNRREQHADKYL